MDNPKTNNWDELHAQSSNTILSFLKSKKEDIFILRKAKVASSVLAACVRHDATQSSRERMIFGIARYIINDKNEFAEYIKLSMPLLNLPSPLPLSNQKTNPSS